jgi:p-methyltransferase
MNKRTTAAQYWPGIALLRDAGIVTFGALIIGFPGETEDTIAETVLFLNASGLDFCYVQPFYYLHNSPVHRQRDEYGLQGEGLVWKHATMNSEECLDHLDWMFREVTGPAYANEEYAMWELIYFHYKGFDTEHYRDYRQMINSIRAINLESREEAERCARHAPIVNGFREKFGPGM